MFKLSPANPQEIVPAIAPLLIPGVEEASGYKVMRDFVVFTSRRLIAVNVQGMTGAKRKRLHVLAVLQVQVYSIETAGTFDLDSESDLWFSGLGKVRLEFKGQVDIGELGDMIAQYVL